MLEAINLMEDAALLEDQGSLEAVDFLGSHGFDGRSG